ncbi:MAG: LacI family transcriptional regulator, partial [Cellulomonadaceae bacterium]|nr:LacI family transcriptional regulator [Cellulomonadaceae bacterium]
MHPPTIEDVAREAGVSRSTASRAVRGESRVSPQARAAVDAAVQRIGYFPNLAARSLVTRRTDSIALVVPEPDSVILNDPFLTGVLRGTNDGLASTDLQLILLIARADDSTTGRIVRYLKAGHVDGVLIASHHRSDHLEEALTGSDLPAVFVGRPETIGDTFLPYVDVDNAGGARAATEYLLSQGRSRVAHIAGPQDMPAGADRLAG